MKAANPTSPLPWVAEVWLEWEVCPGSTMYRGHFKYKWQAWLAAKAHAMMADWILPTHYPSQYSSGRRYYEKYEFEIRFGVRRTTAAPGDAYDFSTLILPGHRGHRGEHPSAHPTRGEFLPETKETT